MNSAGQSFHLRPFTTFYLLFVSASDAQLIRDEPRPQTHFAQVPGVVVDYSPQSSGIYIGSPSLAALTNGLLVASHDEFGPNSTELASGLTHIFHSQDRGQKWHRITTVQGQYWSTLFSQRGELYLLGTDRHLGRIVIRRSVNGGFAWTSPTNSAVGLLSSGTDANFLTFHRWRDFRKLTRGERVIW